MERVFIISTILRIICTGFLCYSIFKLINILKRLYYRLRDFLDPVDYAHILSYFTSCNQDNKKD